MKSALKILTAFVLSVLLLSCVTKQESAARYSVYVTNETQYQLLKCLTSHYKTFTVVGDDDQGMYRFRGATIRNILEFADNFEKDECKIFYLDENYRSEPGIIRFYSSWMSDDNSEFDWGKYRFSKQLQACKPGKSDAPAVFACGGDSLDAEKEELLALIKNLF